MSEYAPIPLSSARGDTSAGYANSTVSPVERDADGLHLFIDNPRVVELPEQGCITFRFSRGPVTITEASKSSAARAHVDLTLTEICDVKEEEAPEGVEAKDALDELFAGIREPDEIDGDDKG